MDAIIKLNRLAEIIGEAQYDDRPAVLRRAEEAERQLAEMLPKAQEEAAQRGLVVDRPYANRVRVRPFEQALADDLWSWATAAAGEVQKRLAAQEEAEAERARARAEWEHGLVVLAERFGGTWVDERGQRVAHVVREQFQGGSWSSLGGWKNDYESAVTYNRLVAEDGREIKPGEWIVRPSDDQHRLVEADGVSATPAGLMGTPATSATSEWLPAGSEWRRPIYSSDDDATAAWDAAFEARRLARAAAKEAAAKREETEPATQMAAAFAALRRAT